MINKQCTKCKKLKPLSEFSLNKTTKDGYSCWCKTCKQEYYKNTHKQQVEKYNIPEGYKYCNKCKTVRELKYFNKNCNSPDGYYSICTLCQKEYKKEYKEKQKVNVKTKQCNYCHKEKSVEEFYKNSYSLDGYSTYCKECQNIYYYKNREKILENRRIRQEKLNKIIVTEKYCPLCKQIKPASEFYKDNYIKDGLHYCCIDCQKQKEAERYLKRKQNINYRLSNNFSTAIRKSLKDGKQGLHWEVLVPYTLLELKAHLESQFNENMTWENYGTYWEIDHIRPVNTFNFSSYNDEQFKQCWSLNNLRPLEKSLNRSRPKDGSDIIIISRGD